MRWRVILLLLAGLASPAFTQIGLPQVGETVGSITGRLGETVDDLAGLDIRQPLRSAAQLAEDRIARLAAFARTHSESVDLDEDGQPARKGIVMLIDPDERALERARQLGFTAMDDESFSDLGLSVTELGIPEGMNLRTALNALRKAIPDKEITADHILFRSGAMTKASARRTIAPLPPISTPVGLIDGGVSPAVATAQSRGFAKGAPAPSDHGTAVASLMRHAGVTRIHAADVYGRDPAGGNALAIVRALNWLAGERVPVVSISLVGPRNPLLERAISAVARRGMTIVAAVGNDGPSAPPAFPASYSQVIAVTGVDGRNRALIEAGRALHLDYAAPGAGMKALGQNGRNHMVRGTSFAAPLVAARIAAVRGQGKTGQALRAALDAEARDLGRKGPDPAYGRGLLCGNCRRQTP